MKTKRPQTQAQQLLHPLPLLPLLPLCLLGGSLLASPDPTDQPAVSPAHRAAEEPWWMQRHQDKVAEATRSQPDIILIGDSITHSWEDLGRKVWSDTFGQYPTLNLGFSGDRTENVLWRLQNGELPDNLQPALVILMIGTNNSGYRKDPPEHTAAGIRAILDELQARLPGRTRILLLGILPRGSSRTGSAEWQRNDAVNQQIAQYADGRRIVYLDLGHRFSRPDGSMRTELMIDQYVHPNEAGYAVWAEAIQTTVHTLIGNGR